VSRIYRSGFNVDGTAIWSVKETSWYITDDGSIIALTIDDEAYLCRGKGSTNLARKIECPLAKLALEVQYGWKIK